VTEPDPTRIPFDDEIEMELGDDEVTPVPGHRPGECWYCHNRAKHINAAEPAPRCERDARENFADCSESNSGEWAVCAGKFMLRLGKFEFYFGPEKRTAIRSLPPVGMPERRAGSPPPFPPRRDDEGTDEA